MSYESGSIIHAVTLSADPVADDVWATYELGDLKSDLGATSLVFHLKGDTPRLAKLFTAEAFTQRVEADRTYAQRLVHLGQANADLRRRFPTVAFPEEIVFDETARADPTHDKIRGVAMPHFQQACSITDLGLDDAARYGLTSSHTVDIAIKLANLLDQLHNHPWRLVVGDLSPNNILISDDFRSVFLIDTDGYSFSVDGGATAFDTPGLTPGFRSPLSFALPEGTPMPPEHDDYVFAIIAFQLFMLAGGCTHVHPFMSLDASEDDNIAARHFPFADAHRANEVHPDPAALFMQWDEPIRIAFERVFTGDLTLTTAEWAEFLGDYRRSLLPA